MGGERHVLAGMALMGEVILDQRQLGFKENQVAGQITEVTVMGLYDKGAIREIYRAICEIPENQAKLNSKEARN